MAPRVDVLVVAARQTREVDGVIDRLRARGLTVSRLAVCQYPDAEQVSWSPHASHYAYGAPRAAWLRDFSGWSVESKLTGLERATAIAETAAFVEGMLLSLQTNWLSPPGAIRVSSRKLLQLKTAVDLGIAVPETCATNAPESAREFCARHSAVVVKTLASSYFTYGDKNYKFYTRRLRDGKSELLQALRLGPLILQREISKREEVRVTVVDQKAFAVKLNLETIGDGEVDIRRLNYEQHQRAFEACFDREDLIEFSKRIVSALGLGYAGVDWAVDQDRNAYFLECNPLGSFKWFEICGGHDITGSIADALERRCRS